MKLAALLEEWFSGLTESKEESALFARRWHLVAGMRAYTPHVEDIGPVIAKVAKAGSLESVNVRLAVGADGKTDVRVELVEPKGEPTVTRWRPKKSQLDWVAYENGLRSGPTRPEEKALSRAMKLDLESAEFADTHEAVVQMKRRRNVLRDMAEAGADVGAELADLAIKYAAIRDRHDSINLARKLKQVRLDVDELKERSAAEPENEVLAIALTRTIDIRDRLAERAKAARGKETTGGR